MNAPRLAAGQDYAHRTGRRTDGTTRVERVTVVDTLPYVTRAAVHTVCLPDGTAAEAYGQCLLICTDAPASRVGVLVRPHAGGDGRLRVVQEDDLLGTWAGYAATTDVQERRRAEVCGQLAARASAVLGHDVPVRVTPAGPFLRVRHDDLAALLARAEATTP